MLAAYIRTMARFRSYSFGNILEIARQKPDATRVAGFWKWKELGRSVKKGEKGIRILAPIIGVKRKPKEESKPSVPLKSLRLFRRTWRRLRFDCPVRSSCATISPKFRNRLQRE